MFAYMTTNALYAQARNQARWSRFRSMLTGHSRGLFPLEKIEADCSVRTRSDAGLQTVPIHQIRGSEGRSHDFDRDFNPFRDYNKERWLGIAMARHHDQALPPVELIQVGDVYFVRDGHHRISVARTLSQQDIKAEVIVWQVNGPLLWERGAEPQQPYQKVGANNTKLQECFWLNLRHLLSVIGMKLRAPWSPK